MTMEPLLSTAAAPPADAVKDTDTARFAVDVIDASMTTPVIVDFWAPWCGPCKQLGPMLEKAVLATRGKVRMVKLNIDDNQQIAAQMRIQSIPAVYAFFQGRPVDGFVGAVPESQIKSFVENLVKMGGDPNDAVDEALAQAKAALDDGDTDTAGAIYSQILQAVPDLAAAIAGLARVLIATGRTDDARRVLDQAPEEARKTGDIAAVLSSLELAEQTSGQIGEIPSLRDRVAKDPADHAARIDLAMALYGAGDSAGAIDELIESIRRDRDWNEQAARKQLLKIFEALGPTDPVTVAGRRKLSSILFS